MVIFHSYVSLPEGNMIILEMDEANQKHTAEKPDKVPWLSRAFTLDLLLVLDIHPA
jgi:hypothetical protein